jgi:predicted transcriptional regulator
MLEYLFANKNVEKVLIYLYLHGKANATELSRTFSSALDPIQKTLRKLEEGGLLASFLEGRTRVFQWNPRYPFLEEIQALAKKAYSFLPPDIQETRYKSRKRKRPRKTGKPL